MKYGPAQAINSAVIEKCQAKFASSLMLWTIHTLTNDLCFSRNLPHLEYTQKEKALALLLEDSKCV